MFSTRTTLSLDELTPFLQGCAEKEPEMYVALYADESVPYRFIDHDSCQRFGRSLLFALRQQHLYGIGRHHRRGKLTPFLQGCAEKEPEMYVALYADESVPYREIVRVEYQQQEDDVRHGCHTEIGRYSISSF